MEAGRSAAGSKLALRQLDRESSTGTMNLGSMTTNVNNQQIMTLTAGFNSGITDKLVRAAINYKFD